MTEKEFLDRVPLLPKELAGPKLQRLIEITAFCNGLNVFYTTGYFYSAFLLAAQQN